MKSAITQYVNLTKPTIVLLFAITGLATLVVEKSLLNEPLKFFLITLGICLTAGSANALNMFFDRDIDEIMPRTKRKRPIPLHRVSPKNALVFGIVIGIIATGLLYFYGNLLAASMGLATIGFYIGIYTLILKRRTPYNIVIGGAAGSTAPLIAWAAATGSLSLSSALIAWLLFAIIFIWTPPHFWALAIVIKEEYRKANVPMLPVTHGDHRTRMEILVYTILLVATTFYPDLMKVGGPTYTIGAVILGMGFLYLTWNMIKKKTDRSAYGVFGYSIVYLLALFLILMFGSLIHSA